jgi:membrane protein YqaA with SNARE-associated domain
VSWLVVWLLAAGLNAVPAFMPPTWSVLAYFHLYQGLPVVPLALVGALGATTGRAILALGSRAFGERFIPRSWQANVDALVTTLQSRPALALPSLALFALGPVPSNHLFVAAGLARAPLPPILAVFGSARFVSYVLWVSAADVADQSLRDALGSRLGGWGVIALQVAGFVLIVLAMRVDWLRLLKGRTRSKPSAE